MAISIDKVKRLHGMVRAAVPDQELDGNSAPALTSTYASLRSQISDSLEGELKDEFEAFFPELEVVSPPGRHSHEVGLFPSRFASAAQGAATKIRLMDGWLDSLITETESADR